MLGPVDGQERSIPRADVADMQPGTISLMPAGFADQLSRQELADLLAFLKGTRWEPEPERERQSAAASRAN